MRLFILLVSVLSGSIGLWGQSSPTSSTTLQHPYALDLRAYSVDHFYEMNLAHHKISVPLTYIDWEVVLHEAAANFDLKRILLPEKEALYSLAVSLEVLSHQVESSFFNRRKTYRKFFKKYLTREEQQYLDEKAEEIAKMNQGLEYLALWKYIFDCAQTTRQYELVADSLVQIGYRVQGHDAEDLDAVVAAYLGYHYMAKNDYQNAVQHFEHCYTIRKKRKDQLDVNIKRIRTCYQKLGQSDQLKALNLDILEITKEVHPSKRSFSEYIVADALDRLLKEDTAAAFQYYKQTYINVFSLADRHYNIYEASIAMAKNDDERIKWLNLWLEEVDGRIKKNKDYRGMTKNILETLKKYPSKQIEEKRRIIFEKYGFAPHVAGKWKTLSDAAVASWDEEYWFHEVPYGRLLQYTELVEEKEALLKHWMQMALKTNNDSIIEATGLSVSNKLMNIGAKQLADEYFEEYYCKRRKGKSIATDDWYNRVPYLNESSYYLERWVTLAKTYASEDMAMDIYLYSILFVGDDPDDAIRYERYSKVLAHYMEKENHQKQYFLLRLIISACQKIPFPDRLEHAIQLCELSSKMNRRYNLSVLNTVMNPILVADFWNRKELKRAKRILKHWRSVLKKNSKREKEVLNWVDNHIMLLKKNILQASTR